MHKNAEVRRQAIIDLRKRETNAINITPILIKSLWDDDWRVRKTAVEILLDIRGEAVTKELINTLYCEENANARNSAIEVLIALGHESIDYLIEAYKNANPDVKKFIIDIIGSMADLKALPLLLKALEDKDENVRAAAVEHLGNIRNNASVVKALIAILKKADVWVAYPAAEALGRIGDAKAVSALISVLSQKALRKPVIWALGQIAEVSSLATVVYYLKDKSKTVREETIKAVERFFQKGISEETIIENVKRAYGNEIVQILLPHTQSDKKDVRTSAILLLGLLKDKTAIAPLLEMSVEEDLQESIVKALVFIGKSMPESLVPFFDVSDSYQRRIVCEVVGRVNAAIFFKPLVACIKDEDGHVRAKAVIALSNLDNPKAVKYIRPLLLDEYEDVQESAIKGLARLKKWIDLEEIIMGLSDKNHAMRMNSAILLGFLREQGSVEALGVALKDSDARVRVAVAEALGVIGGPGAIEYLLLALSDEFSKVRRIAAIALGRMRVDEGVEPLILLLRDSDIWVRAGAARGLGEIGNKKAAEPLIKQLSDESGFVRTTVIEALCRFKEEKVKNVLLQLLSDKDPEIRSTAVESLASFDGIAQDIIPLLKDRVWAVRKKVVDVLGSFFRDESLAYLKEIANTDDDSQVRETAARYAEGY
jgi:HEAT repeat protein